MREPFIMWFDIGVIKNLGLQMYSTLPSVISELVANAWDADATKVEITIPEKKITDNSEIIVLDNGVGMNDDQIREGYMTVGRDRRSREGTERTLGLKRPLMGRKGIGKFAGFGIARTIKVETAPIQEEASGFEMDYEYLQSLREREDAKFEVCPTDLEKGTKVTLINITKFRDHPIDIGPLRKRLARRFSVIGAAENFAVFVNQDEITPDERNLKQYLDEDMEGKPYLWEYEDEPIDEEGNLTISGWIGALKRTDAISDEIDRGIAIMARGKLVQAPFTFEATVGQQYALSYLIGEIHAEFVDAEEDTIATNRNTLVWDVYENKRLMKWGKKEVNRIAREWATRRGKDKEKLLEKNQRYMNFVKKADAIGNERNKRFFDKFVRDTLQNTTPGDDDQGKVNRVLDLAIDYMEFDQFWEMVEEIKDTQIEDLDKIVSLFREWEIVEAKEMMRITKGRIEAIGKFEKLIRAEAKEVPDVHAFLKEFPWTLDPRWTLISDETRYSELLRTHFPGSKTSIEKNRRIDFLCVKESETLVVVEIKRPGKNINKEDLEQIESYVQFLRGEVAKSNDEERLKNVIGYLLCSSIVDKSSVREKKKTLEKDSMYVKTYRDLLSSVENLHREFLKRYKKLQKIKTRTN